MKKIITLLVIVGMAFSANAQEVSDNTSRNTLIYNQYKALVESGEYMFTANWVISGNKRDQLVAETNTVSFKRNKVTSQLISPNSNTNLKLDEEGAYGVFYSDESELIKIVFTLKNNDTVSDVKIEIKNGKVFLRIDGKSFSDTTWIGQLTAI